MRLYWIWLSLRQGMSEQERVRALSYFGSPEDCYYADAAACGNVEGLRSSAVEAILDKDLTEAEKILLVCEKQKIKILLKWEQWKVISDIISASIRKVL